MASFLKKYGYAVATVIVVLALAAAFAVKFWPSAPTYDVIKAAPDFELENVDGQKMTLSDTKGKVRLVYFYYSHCPDVCQPTTYMLSKVQERLIDKGVWGDKTAIYSITFDPEKDTAEHLKEYSSRFVQDPSGWFFLRGEEEATIQLAKEYGILVVKEEDGLFTHSNLVVLVDKENNIRNYYYADNAEFDPVTIADDMIRLSKE